MFHNQRTWIQLQTVFYPGYSQRNIKSVQAPFLGKKNLLVDKSDNHVYYIVSLAKFGNRCSMVLAHRQDQWEGNNHRVFCFEGGEKS